LNVTGTEFKRVLDVTLADLQNRARQNGVQLPVTNYAFSFDAQRSKVQFAAGSMPLLPELLAEVSAVCSRLFEAKVSKILDLKRPLTPDDPSQAPGCHRLPRETNPDLGFVLSPYEVTFLTFSSELADALESFYQATNCFLVKVIVVEAGVPGAGGGGASEFLPLDPATGLPGMPPNPAQPPPPMVGGRPGRGVRNPPPAGGPATRPGRPPPGPGAAPGEVMRTVLNERLFKVTCLVMLVKPSK
jgi:hypothetical protein